MVKSDQNSSYYAYLTEKMDRGESKNIVMPTVVGLIIQHLEIKTNASVLDIGCFNGSMLNQIWLLTPKHIRLRVRYVGAEIDKSLISDGRGRYPDLNFEQVDLRGSVSHLGLHDIVIVSNVLHEVIPDQIEYVSGAERAVSDTLHKIATLTKIGGNFVVFDGLRPDNDNEQIFINHKTSNSCQHYKVFAEQYTAFKIEAEKVGENQTKTRVKDLAAFLTKARYLHKAYWQIESNQLYQFLTREQFYREIEMSGFSVERFEPQEFPQERMDEMFSSITPQIEYPAKNVLIVARRV